LAAVGPAGAGGTNFWSFAGIAHRFTLTVAAVIAVAAANQAAFADELVYTPINPSFGGNPFNSSHLLGIANAQNDYEAPRDSNQTLQGEQFVRLLQSRLLSALATRVSDAILGENAQPSGEIVYGSQTVAWETLLDSIRLTVTDTDTGAVTEIIIPSLPPVG
jgi:curli production assembly/transport component CsgF